MRRIIVPLLCLAMGGCASLGGKSEESPRPRDRFFSEDKLQHFFVSFLATSLSASGARAAGMDRETSLWVGAGTGTTLGVLKELNDMRDPKRNTPSLLDFVWDVGGVAAGTAVAAQAQ